MKAVPVVKCRVLIPVVNQW